MKRVLGLVGALALVLATVDTAECGYPGGCQQCNCESCNPGVFTRLFGGLCPGGVCGPSCRNGACGPGGPCFGHGGHFGGRFGGPGVAGMGGYGGYGPPTPTVVYPYYTLRGPRDFLDPHPLSPGP